MKEFLHPSLAAKIDQQAKEAEREAISLWKRFTGKEKDALREYYELGRRLAIVQENRKGQDFVAWMEKHELPVRRCYEAIKVAKNWPSVCGSANLSEALKALKGNIFLQDEEDSENAISSDADASDEENEEEEIDVSGDEEEEDCEPTEAPDGSGDAAETPPEGALVDADGLTLPESVRPAVEGLKSVNEWLDRLAALAKDLPAAIKGPSGMFIPEKEVKNFLNRARDRVLYYSPAPKMIYRCNLCQGAGCKKCKKQGWIPKTLLKEES